MIPMIPKKKLYQALDYSRKPRPVTLIIILIGFVLFMTWTIPVAGWLSYLLGWVNVIFTTAIVVGAGYIYVPKIWGQIKYQKMVRESQTARGKVNIMKLDVYPHRRYDE